MKKLIRSYLQHIGHHYADKHIRYINGTMGQCGFVYNVGILGAGTWNDVDEVDIELSDLLVYMFERQA